MKKMLYCAAVACFCVTLLAGGAQAGEPVASKAAKSAPAAVKSSVKGTAAAAAVAADFSLPGIDGKLHTLSASRGKEPVLLFFWTTWCPYCRKALKTVKDAAAELNESQLRVYAINVGEEPNKVAAFVKAGDYGFDILLDKSSDVAHQFGLIGVPTYLLIDKNGTIVFRGNYYPKGKFKQLLGA